MDPTFLETLPEELRANEAITAFENPEALVRAHLDATEKLKTPSGFDALPDEVKKDPNIAKYKSVEELAKGHIDSVKLIGKKGVVIPAADAPQEEKDKFLNALGRPEKSEAYKFTPIENLHQSIKITPESENVFKGVAHKLGLTQQQADGLNSWYLGTSSQILAQQEVAEVKDKEGTLTKLRAEWGPEFNNNLAMANRVVQKFGGKEAVDAIGDMGNNIAALKLFAAIGRKMSESAMNHGEISDLVTTATDAKGKIKEVNEAIMKEKSGTPAYNELLEKRTQLYRIAYPEGSLQ